MINRHVFGNPEGMIMLKGVHSEPERISTLGSDFKDFDMRTMGSHKGNTPVRFFSFPEDIEIGFGQMIKIEFDESIRINEGWGDNLR